MSRIGILGSTGMIGSGVTAGLSRYGHEIVEFNRAGTAVCPENKVYKFNINRENLQSEISNLEKFDYILNFVGLIRHKLKIDQAASIDDAELLNVQLPSELDNLAHDTDCKVIQIGTDCVFSGAVGKYDEFSRHDPSDVYGQTKSNGEARLSRTMNLRVSVVGKELYSNIELMSWLLNQPKNAEVQGYNNHLWNGVTPTQLSRVINSVVTNDLFSPKSLHLVPANVISKYELLQSIATLGGRHDIQVQPVAAASSIDRTLSTAFPDWNMKVWNSAGYPEIPRIQDMIAEYIDQVD